MSFYSSPYSDGYGYSSGSQGSLLQSVIRKLEDSLDDEERMQHYKEIQEDLLVEEERMETLVKENQDKLQGTLTTFSKIDSTIRDSQSKVRMLKDNLGVCKTQLRCKREELKRLWLDEVKYKQMIKILDQVGNIKGVSKHLNSLRDKKHYLEATEVLKNTVALLEGPLSGVDALRELRGELKQQKENFHNELIKELQHHLYTPLESSFHDRQVTTQGHKHNQINVQKSQSPSSSPSTPKRGVQLSRGSFRANATKSLVNTPPLSANQSINIQEDYISTLVEALAMLRKMPEMIEAVQQRMKIELLLIVEKASIKIVQSGNKPGIPPSMRPSASCDNSRYLLELLETCFTHFEMVVISHRHLLELLAKSKKEYGATYELYTEEYVWVCIQVVLKDILDIYLAIDDDKPQTSVSAYSHFTIGGHEFPFLRRRTHARGRKQPLFRFDNSRHALSISSYIKEQRDKELSVQHESVHLEHQFDNNQPSISQHLVCRPTTRNITAMYGPMRSFVLMIEEKLEKQTDSHGALFEFLQYTVEQRYLDSVQSIYTERLQNSLKLEARQTLSMDPKTLRSTGKQALLTSAIVLWQCIQELQQQMTELSMYSSHFMSIILQLTQTYQNSCFTLYRDLTTVSAERSEKHSHRVSVISAQTAKDEDINRLLRSMVSWARLTAPSQSKAQYENTGIGKESIHSKESHNLLVGPGREVTLRAHILHDFDNIKLLAVLHETLEWFAGRLKGMAEQIIQWQDTAKFRDVDRPWEENIDGAGLSRPCLFQHEEVDDIKENEQQTKDSLDQFTKCVGDLFSLSETVLIMLHLELRCHCCYHLLPALKQSNYVCEDEVSDVDNGVKDLAYDLTGIRTTMAGVLTSDKQIYLFDGIGHLISEIFMNSTSYLKKININGVKKMCRNIQFMQSCLSKITSIRERDLDLTQKYFAMLYVNDEEFLKLVMEEGKQFTMEQYANALKLLARSQYSNEIRLQNNLDKLESMFSDDAC